jgi:hypothetical protein
MLAIFADVTIWITKTSRKHKDQSAGGAGIFILS